MAADDSETVWKFANALIPDAQPVMFPKRIVGGIFYRFRDWVGGLWIGGTVTLTADTISFEANSMNRALHTGLQSSSIPLSQVQRVADRFGVLTGIVDVERDDGTVLTFRCFGARAFARLIAQRARRRSGRILR